MPDFTTTSIAPGLFPDTSGRVRKSVTTPFTGNGGSGTYTGTQAPVYPSQPVKPMRGKSTPFTGK